MRINIATDGILAFASAQAREQCQKGGNIVNRAAALRTWPRGTDRLSAEHARKIQIIMAPPRMGNAIAARPFLTAR